MIFYPDVLIVFQSTPEISSVQPQATYYYPSNVPYPNQSTMGVLQPNVFVSSITNQNHPSQSQPQYVYIQQQPNQPFFPNGQSQQTQLPAIQQSRLQPDVNLNNDGGNKVVYYPYQQQSEPLMVPGGMTYTEQWANQLTTWAQDQRSDGCLSPRTVPTNAPQSNVYMSGPHGPPGYISASQSEAGVPVHRPSHFYPHLMQSVPEGKVH